MVEEEVSTNEYANTQAKKRKQKGLEEKLNLFLEKNKPTNPSKWSYYKSQAKKKEALNTRIYLDDVFHQSC